jgi:hypothetical protein
VEPSAGYEPHPSHGYPFCRTVRTATSFATETRCVGENVCGACPLRIAKQVNGSTLSGCWVRTGQTLNTERFGGRDALRAVMLQAPTSLRSLACACHADQRFAAHDPFVEYAPSEA